MKKATLIVALMLTSLVIIPLKGQIVSGNGNVVKKERETSSFSAIKVTDGIDIFLSQGNSVILVIEADENLHEYLKTEVSDGTLKIYTDANIRKSKAFNVHITLKDIHFLDADDGSDVSTETKLELKQLSANLNGGSDLILEMDAQTFDCKLNEGSDAEIEGEIEIMKINASEGSDIEAEISTQKLNCYLNEGSDADLKGYAKNFIAEAKEGSDIQALDLEVETCIINVEEGSDALLYVTKAIELNARGGSDVVVKGKPETQSIKACDDCDVVLR